MMNASTAEVDDPKRAVEEILGQVDLEKGLLRNSVGIIACYAEFIETGVVEALCGRLPFAVVGCTTLGNAARGRCGLELLSLTVLTSDDIRFAAAVSGPVSGENLKGPLSAAYDEARQGAAPDFILAYAPLMRTLGGNLIFNALNGICGGIPFYGTLSCDHTLKYTESRVIYNGKAASDIAALILMFGPVKPRFYLTAIPDKNVLRQTAVITESQGNILKKVNGMTLAEHLTSLGLAQNNQIKTVGSLPLLIDYHDGTAPVGVAIYGITPDGAVICGGDVPEGAALSIGTLDYHDILASAEAILEKISQEEAINGMLIYPCLSRSMMLGPNADDEMKKVLEVLKDRYPYQICYAGGEFCPVKDEGGNLVNHFHNFSFTLCVF
jgi:hypothetical protein